MSQIWNIFLVWDFSFFETLHRHKAEKKMADLVDDVIADLENKLDAAKKAKKAGIKVVEPKTETNELDEAEIRAAESRKFFAAQCASIERERSRLKAEQCVRLGDSFFHEISLVEAVDKALEKVQSNYLKLC